MLFAPSTRNLILPLLAALLLATTAAAQGSATQDGFPTSSAPPDPPPYPIATIFLPGSLHELPGDNRNLAASVITAVSGLATHVSYQRWHKANVSSLAQE
jgi:hypothetical protein